MSASLQPSLKVRNLTLRPNAGEASVYAAHKIANLIREKQNQGENAVLGLATGNTPIRIYQELIRLHKSEGLSFENVISFNLDEYYPISRTHNQSYTYFMNQYLFGQIDIDPQNVHIPHTDCSLEEIAIYCGEYEAKIAGYGGLDLQLLGIGRNGHIGFNEPGSTIDSTTRLVNLHHVTRNDAVESFGTMENVPQQAVSIGIHTIMQAKMILLMALGEHKSEIISKALKGKISSEIPASFLRTLPQVEYILDREAASLI